MSLLEVNSRATILPLLFSTAPVGSSCMAGTAFT